MTRELFFLVISLLNPSRAQTIDFRQRAGTESPWFVILSFNLQWLEVEGGVGNTQSKLFKKKIVLGRLIKILQATWSEHALQAVDKDNKGMLSFQAGFI